MDASSSAPSSLRRFLFAACAVGLGSVAHAGISVTASPHYQAVPEGTPAQDIEWTITNTGNTTVYINSIPFSGIGSTSSITFILGDASDAVITFTSSDVFGASNQFLSPQGQGGQFPSTAVFHTSSLTSPAHGPISTDFGYWQLHLTVFWSDGIHSGGEEPGNAFIAVYDQGVPTPGSSVLLALGGLTLSRRRRPLKS